jgi:mRNA-degrading endonuclease toxin of MazEF toxin-antitoxin module
MGSGSATQGVVTLCHVHTFDFQVRGARFIEEVDDVVVEECLDVLDVMTH